MLKVSARNNSHGFSLLELVIVVFLIALFSIVAVLRIGVSQGVVIESEAQQFAQRLNLLMDESLLSGRLYRIVFDAQQQAYEYQRYDNGWNAVSEIPFKKKSLPSAVAFELDIKQTDEIFNTESLIPNDEQTQFEQNFGVRTGLEIENNQIVEIGSNGASTQFDIRFGERGKKGLIETQTGIWLVQGGHSVIVVEADSE